jgi:homoserine dehydrogenase
MKIQLIGFGNVGKNLVMLIKEKEDTLRSLKTPLRIISVSDSKGTARNAKGLDIDQILERKAAAWKGLSQYVEGYSAINAIDTLESDVVVELTPTTSSGQPGLSHIKTALMQKKNVVTANKGPLVVAYEELMKLAEKNHVRLLYEATVGAHLPVFCMVKSCFKADQLAHLEGILNATTNFIIGEMEKGRDFQSALNYAITMGWAETNYSDDVDGIDAARKVVILANSFFKSGARIEDVKIEGIRKVGQMLKEARRSHKRVKLICGISKKGNAVEMSVAPRLISSDDPLATVRGGDMALKFVFKTSKQIFVSAQFTGVRQTACAVLNDIIKIGTLTEAC